MVGRQTKGAEPEAREQGQRLRARLMREVPHTTPLHRNEEERVVWLSGKATQGYTSLNLPPPDFGAGALSIVSQSHEARNENEGDKWRASGEQVEKEEAG